MRVKFLPLLFLLILCGLKTIAQDIHFTQYYMSPVTLNPALAGKFEGTVRLGGIYRSQWRSVLGSGDYSTPSFFADAPVVRGFRKRDWVGVGLGYVADRAGIGKLERNISNIGASYHLALDKKGNAHLSVGAQYGGVAMRLKNPNSLKDELKILNGTSPDLTALDANSKEDPKSYRSINAGLAISSKLNKQMDVTLGLSAYNLTGSSIKLLESGSSKGGGKGSSNNNNGTASPRIVAHGMFNITMNERTVFSPNFIFQRLGNNQEMMVQALGAYLLEPQRDITATAGIGYRLGDAINVLVGGKYKDWRFGLAYDINTSGLSANTQYRGGFELALNYTIKIYKPAVVKPKVICPRF